MRHFFVFIFINLVVAAYGDIRPNIAPIETDEYWEDVIIGRVLIIYKECTNVHKASIKELGLVGKNVKLVQKLIPPLNIIEVEVPGGIEGMKEFIKFMNKQPNVKCAEPNRWMKYLFEPNDPFFNRQWDKKNMKCPQAWDITLGDTAVITVAVVDQGTQYTHPDLAAHFYGYKGYDFFDNDPDPKPEVAGESHGTHCTGIIGAVINNSVGIAGVVTARLYAYRCGNIERPSAVAGANSIQDAANRGAKVISMSWGGEINEAVRNAVKNAYDKGVLLFSGSGNEGRRRVFYPAAYPEVICVGSIGPGNQRSWFSNYGPEMELVAPGEDILSTVPFDRYSSADGTSQACPNAAGAGALVWSANPSLTNKQVREILTSTAVDLGTQGRDEYYGYGKVDVYAAVQRARPSTPAIALLNHSFTDANSNREWEPGEQISITVTIRNSGVNATNVMGTLSVSGADITLGNVTYNFGTIAQGATGSNSSTPYTATASQSAQEREVTFTLRITADGGYSTDLSFSITIGGQRFDFVDVPAANAKLTVTDIASIGFMGSDQQKGSGFVYPKNGNNALYFGSMAFGNSAEYLVDNWYISGTEDRDWKTTTSPLGKIKWIRPPVRGDTMCEAYYQDSEHPSPKNVLCRQVAWAFNSKSRGDFVILEFQYTNNGATAVSDLYSAVFCDFDIGEGRASMDNNANINNSKYLAYMDYSNVYVGITLIHPTSLFANASTINNSEYVYPDTGMTDANQWSFMNRTLHFEAQSDSDYSVMVSAGPFTLEPNGTQTVVFAIVGGTSVSQIESNSDTARGSYGVEEVELPLEYEFIALPTITRKSINIKLVTPAYGDVSLNIYDISGRMVHTIITRKLAKGSYTFAWDGKDNYGKEMASGIYYCKLTTENTTLTKKFIVIK